MSDGDLQITIAADASGVGQGADQAKAAIASLVSTLSGAQSTFAGFGAAVVKAFAPPNLSGLTGAVGQVRSTLDGVRPSIDGFAGAFQGVAGKIKDGFGGVGAALNGLKTAGAAGAEGLAGLAEAGGGATAAIAAAAAIALSAAAAIASWAERTKDSSAASAEARENAASLSNALTGAGTAFGQVGDTLAGAFAPTLTSIVGSLTAMANAFETSYNNGGLAKTSVDLLVASVNSLVSAVTAVVTWWKTEIDVVSDVGRAGSDAFGLLGLLAQDLKNTLTSALAPAFKAVQDAAATAWSAVQSSFDTLLKAVTGGYNAWKALNAPLIGAIGGIRSAFAAVESAAQSVFQNIVGWIVKVSSGLADFLDKLPGVGSAFDRLRADLAKAASDAKTDFGTLSSVVSPSQPPAAASVPAKASPAGGSAGATAGGDGACACDPNAAQASAVQSQTAQGEAVKSGQSQTVALTTAANAQISASNNAVTTTAIANSSQQAAAAKASDAAKTASSADAARQILANEKKAFEEFKSSLNQTVAVFTKGLLEMAEGAKSLSQVMRSIGQQILGDMLKVVDGMIDKWALGVAENVLASTQGQALLNALSMKDLALYIARQTGKTAASSAGNAAIVASDNAAAAAGSASTLAVTMATLRQDAAKVFGGIFAALSQNPATLPAAAPAAAAGAAMVMSYAAGGWGEVPADDMPTLLHKQEMVLPARLANPMRDMLSSYNSAGGPPAGGHSFSFGDTHIHGAPDMSPSDFKQALSEHRSSVAEAVAGALRGGWRPSYKQPVGAL